MDAFRSRSSYDVHEVTFFFIVFQTVDITQRHRRRGRSAMFGRRRFDDDDDTCGDEQSPTKQTYPRTAAAEQNSHRGCGGGGGDVDDDDDGTAAEETDEESEREMRKWVIRELSRGEERGDRRRRTGELTAIRAERMTARAREDQ